MGSVRTVCGGAHPIPMSQRGARDLPTGCRVPDARCAVSGGCNDAESVRTIRSGDQLVGVRFPAPVICRPVAESQTRAVWSFAAVTIRAPVRAVGGGVHSSCVSVQHRDLPASCRIPNACGVIERGCNDACPVRTVNSGLQPVCMSIQHCDLRAGNRVPDARGAI